MIRYRAGLALLALAACSGTGDEAPRAAETRLAEPQDVLSEPLMLALAQARNHHHKADLHLHDGDVAAATASVRAILAMPFPPGAPEAQDVVLDARARLAKLELGAGHLELAIQVVDEGLAAASRESFFLANLHTVRGELLEAEAAATPDQEAGRALRREAIAAYDRAIAINSRLQERLTKELSR